MKINKNTVLDMTSSNPLPCEICRPLILFLLAFFCHKSPKKVLRVLFKIQDDIVKLINHVGMRYEGGIHPKHRLIQYHDFFTNKISKDENVLDIGCGYGAVAYSIAKKTGAKVCGIDYNPNQIAMANKLYKHQNLIFEIGDGTKIKAFTNISTIVISNVLEHIHDRIDLLKSSQRIVNPKRWLIRVPLKERDWSIGLREELGVLYYLDSDHKIEYTVDTFKAEIALAGLRVNELNIRWAEIWAEVAL